jgi:hypothetical protein
MLQFCLTCLESEKSEFILADLFCLMRLLLKIVLIPKELIEQLVSCLEELFIFVIKQEINLNSPILTVFNHCNAMEFPYQMLMLLY